MNERIEFTALSRYYLDYFDATLATSVVMVRPDTGPARTLALTNLHSPTSLDGSTGVLLYRFPRYLSEGVTTTYALEYKTVANHGPTLCLYYDERSSNGTYKRYLIWVSSISGPSWSDRSWIVRDVGGGAFTIQFVEGEGGEGGENEGGEEGCAFPGRVGDGFCDRELMSPEECALDGGDCCEVTCVDGQAYECGVNGYYCAGGGTLILTSFTFFVVAASVAMLS